MFCVHCSDKAGRNPALPQPFACPESQASSKMNGNLGSYTLENLPEQGTCCLVQGSQMLSKGSASPSTVAEGKAHREFKWSSYGSLVVKITLATVAY